MNQEIVISDDGSTDNTTRIIKEFQQKDHRIKFFQNKLILAIIKILKSILFMPGDYIAIADHGMISGK
ncbi:MAG: glycosyltransferase [Chitinophagaceae bacterium]|nr:glycosyltransferase [Chitinophagaceae bacterium]